MQPAIGRDVHYRLTSSVCRSAKIVDVKGNEEQHAVTLLVFLNPWEDRFLAQSTSVTLFSVTGMPILETIDGVAQDKDGASQTWHAWEDCPERD